MKNIKSFENFNNTSTDIKSKIEASYGQYWQYVKDVVDEKGWVYTKDVPHMLDAYFQSNTKKEIEFQKSQPFDKNPDNPLRKGSRWRPKELSNLK